MKLRSSPLVDFQTNVLFSFYESIPKGTVTKANFLLHCAVVKLKWKDIIMTYKFDSSTFHEVAEVVSKNFACLGKNDK